MTLTPATFKARYTEFASVADATVTIFLTEGQLFVDASWPAAYVDKAHGLVTAHLLKYEGYGAASSAQSVGGLKSLEGVTEFEIDDLRVKFSDAAVTRANADTLSATSYGRQFVELRSKVWSGGVWAR